MRSASDGSSASSRSSARRRYVRARADVHPGVGAAERAPHQPRRRPGGELGVEVAAWTIRNASSLRSGAGPRNPRRRSRLGSGSPAYPRARECGDPAGGLLRVRDDRGSRAQDAAHASPVGPPVDAAWIDLHLVDAPTGRAGRRPRDAAPGGDPRRGRARFEGLIDAYTRSAGPPSAAVSMPASTSGRTGPAGRASDSPARASHPPRAAAASAARTVVPGATSCSSERSTASSGSPRSRGR